MTWEPDTLAKSYPAFAKAVDDLPTVVTGGGLAIAIQIQTDEDAEIADDLFREGRALQKIAKEDPGVKAFRAFVKDTRAKIAEQLALIDGRVDRVNRGLVAYRTAKEEAAREAAREATEAEAAKVAKANAKKAAALERAATQETGQVRRDLRAQAAELRDEPLPDPDAAGDRAAVETRAAATAAGAAPIRDRYHCEVDDLGMVAAVVVGTNPGLLTMAKAIAKDRGAVTLPAEALECKRVKGVLGASVYLNDLARSMGEKFRVPGCRAVKDSGLVNR